MIRFKEETLLTVVSGYDEENDNITDEEEINFAAHADYDAEIFHEDDTDYVDIQFGDGSIALSVLRSSFEIV